MLPTIGPVQEKETNTKVNAIKKEPSTPPLSTFESDLLIIHEGITISKAPKKEAAKTMKIKKNKMLGIQCVLNQLPIEGPKTIANKEPMRVYIKIILIPKAKAFSLALILLFSFIKKEIVIGIIGKTQGVKIAINPPTNAIKKNQIRLSFSVGFSKLFSFTKIGVCFIESSASILSSILAPFIPKAKSAEIGIQVPSIQACPSIYPLITKPSLFKILIF